MKFTAKTIYTIKLFIDLGEHFNEGYISLNDVSRRKDIPKKFIEQIIPLFKNTNLITGTRGNKGGYKLLKNPNSISLKDIVSVTEKDLFNSKSNYSPLDLSINDLDLYIDNYFKNLNLKQLIDNQIEAYSNNYDI